MKYLIGALLGSMIMYLMSADKVQTELLKEGIVNDSFFHIKLDSILEFKRKEHGDG